MKNHIRICLLALMIILGFSQLAAQNTKDYAIQLESEIIDGVTPSIKIKWAKNDLALSYRIFRTDIVSTITDEIASNLDSSKTEFIDKTAVKGTLYLYEVRGKSEIITTYRGKNQALNFSSTGYITTGIDVQPITSFGKVLILVDETMKTPLESELNTLMEDLATEGWRPTMKFVPRAEIFNKDLVRSVKDTIVKFYEDNAEDFKTLFLLGRVAVPYSGNLNPDAHPDHQGAWPADVFYGVMNEVEFSDNSVNTAKNSTKPSRTENVNIPDDGKFDVSQNNIDPVIEIGRVDFFKLSKTFPNKTETELLRNYLNKDHKYRTGEFSPKKQALIADNFGIIGEKSEAFASSGWRNFPILVGAKNLKAGNWFTELTIDSYTAAYGCGGGSYNSVGGIGVSADFASKPTKAVFTMLFGSYFGDWDSDENILRTNLATGDVLTTCWSGRPHWYWDNFAYGYNMGYEAKKAQMNSTTYNYVLLNIYNGQNYGPDGAASTFATRFVHISLLGDPTLRLNDFNTIPKAYNLQLNKVKDGQVKLTWEVQGAKMAQGFNVYRSRNDKFDFVKINKTPVIDYTFTDMQINHNGNVHYMICNIDTVTLPSGRINMISRGTTNSITLNSTSVESEFVQSGMEVTPNPASINTTFKLSLIVEDLVDIKVIDVSGRLLKQIYSGTLESGKHSFNWDFENEGIKPLQGVYFITVSGAKTHIFEKVIIN